MTQETFIGLMVLGGIQLGQFVIMLRKLSGATERREIYPQPLTVKAHTEPAPLEHGHTQYQLAENCTDLHQQIKGDMQRTEERHVMRTEELRREIKSDIKGLHSRTDDILRAVSALGGRIDEMGRRRNV